MIEVWSARAEPARGCGIALVRVLLAGRLGVPASEVPIRRFCARCGASDHGKPYLDGTTLRATGHEPPAPLHFSVSHAGGRVLVALGPVPVGVDLARVADVTPDAAGAILAPGERASGAKELAIMWARKEAVLKATGDGLAIDPTRVRVSPPDAPPTLLAWPRGATDGVRMTDLHLDVDDDDSQDDYVSSLAWLSAADESVVVHPDATALLKGAPR